MTGEHPARDGAMRWHAGKKVAPGGKKKPWWTNHWLAHPCADLAFPFEVGVRVTAALRDGPGLTNGAA